MGRQKGGRSKRDRKNRSVQSLKYKHGETGLEKLPDDELARLVEDSNAIVLPAKPERAAQGGADAAAAGADTAERPEKHLSKSQQRKLRRIQEERERRAKRAGVMQTLAQHQLKQDELQLLRPVAARGQRETKKQALRRALKLQRAGVALPPGVRLFQERRRTSGSDGEEEEEEEGGSSEDGRGSSDEDDEGARSQGAPPAKKLRTEPQPVQQHAAKVAAQQQQPQQQEQPQQLQQQQQQQAERTRQLRDAAAAARQALAVSERRDDEPGEQPARPSVRPLAAGPGGQPRVVLVQRRPEIEAAREGLPIVGMEQEVVEAVLSHDVVVLCGETGCGKTTQVPQFLHEAGFGCRLFPERAGVVGVTQPRRVAAASTAARVADELDGRLGGVVGYQVRHDRSVGEATAIKFMTDGILLREVREDFLLRRYSAIVVDEAHERSLNTDLLCGLLSRVVALRRSLADGGGGEAGGQPVHPLKLIVMSATLRTDDFVANRRLFPTPPPVLRVPARQFPVTVHFSRRTEMHDYVGAAHKKVCQIHRSLPPGGVLVFLTGRREVEQLCRKLRATFNRRCAGQPGGGDGAAAPPAAAEGGDGAAGGGVGEEAAAGLDAFGGDAAEAAEAGGEEEAALEAALGAEQAQAGAADDDFEDESSGDEEDVVVLGGGGFTPEQIAEAERDFEARLGISLADIRGGAGAPGAPGGPAEGGPAGGGPGPLCVLPLYALLPAAQQARVFRPPPPGQRLVVVATNVAETSLTIPGIRYVVDAGRSKQRLLEGGSGLARYDVRWVSKASAEQRAGRAGRTGPGHCYRLYSSAHFNDTFPQHTPPEIANTALEGVVLALKSLGVHRVAGFPFPSPPDPAALAAAERCLVALSALEGDSGELTALGRAMAAYPISPRHARMLLEAAAQEAGGGAAAGQAGAAARPPRVLPYAAALAAVLSVDSPFVAVDAPEVGV